MKKFLIIMGSIAAAFVLATVVVVAVLATKTSKVDFVINTPKTIRVYNKSYTYSTITSDNANFKKLLDSLNGAMKVTKLDQLVSGDKLDTKVRLNENGTKYTSSIKERNVCIQLEYESEQSVIVYDGKDSAKKTYKYLLIVLNGKNGVSDHDVYYSATSTVFEQMPLSVSFNEKGIKGYK